MLPFGSEEFGRWFFGHGNWARRVLWENVPGQMRDADAQVGGVLEQLLKSYGDSIEEFRRQIRALPNQREPYLVRGQESEGEWFFVTEVREEDNATYGKILRLIGEANGGLMPNTGAPLSSPPDEPTWPTWFPWYPYEAINEIGPGWHLKWNEVDYEVVAVRERNFDPRTPVDLYDSDESLANEVWIQRGDTYPFKFSYTDVPLGTGDGTASPPVQLPNVPIWLAENKTPAPVPWLTNYSGLSISLVLDIGGPAVLYDVPTMPYDGTGLLWPEDPLNPGEILVGLPGTEWGTVDYRSGRIELSLQADTATWFEPITARYNVKGFFFNFKPQPVINFLARDFGFENDLNDPEFVQRSTIANITKYFGLKSTWDSYRIRGEISGFQVNAQALYAICDCDLLDGFPADHVFYYDGDCYTDIEPRYVRFDDIAADILYFNHDSGQPWTIVPPGPENSPWAPITDQPIMYEDSSADGFSHALAFALDVCQGYYLGDGAHAPCFVKSVYELDPLNAVDAAVLAANGLASAYRLEIQMTPTQKQVFNFKKGLFGLTEYEGVDYIAFPPGTPPALADPVFWVDADEGYDIPTQTWTVLISSSVVPDVFATSGKHIAVRYWPELWHDCCYCRSYKIRVEIEPMPGSPSATEYYSAGVEMQAAIERLIEKIKKTLVPIHVRIVEFAVQFYDCADDLEPEITACDVEIEHLAVAAFCYYYDWVGEEADAIPADYCSAIVVCSSLTVEETVDGACAGSTVSRALHWFAGTPSAIIMDIDQQGNYVPAGASQNLELRDQVFAVVWSAAGAAAGVVAPGWGNVVTGLDVTSLIAGNDPVTIRVIGSLTLPCPASTRWRFTITP